MSGATWTGGSARPGRARSRTEPHQRRGRAARLAHGGGRGGRARQPAAGPRAVPRLPRAGGGEIVRPATIVVNKATIAASGSAGSPGARPSSASRRACSTRVADGMLRPERRGRPRLLVALWVDPGRDRRDGGARCEPRGDAQRARRRADAGGPDAVRALVDAPRGRGERVLRRRVSARARAADADRVRRDPALRAPARPAVPRGLGSRAAHAAVEATLVIVRSDDGLAGYASGDGLPDAALLERLLVGLDPRRTEVVRELCETVDFHGGAAWIAEVAVWDLVGARARRAAVAAARRALRAAARVRLERRAGRAGGARAARRRAARRGRARRQAPLPPRRLARRRRGGRGGSRRGRRATSR